MQSKKHKNICNLTTDAKLRTLVIGRKRQRSVDYGLEIEPGSKHSSNSGTLTLQLNSNA